MDLFLLAPPDFSACRFPADPDPAPGVIILGRLTSQDFGDPDRLARLRNVRIAVPWAPLVLHVPMDSAPALLHLPTVLGISGARALVPDPCPDETMLRSALVDPVGWRRQLPGWAEALSPELPAPEKGIVDAVLLGRAPVGPRARIPAREVNRCLALASIGPRRKLEALIRLVTTLQYLWADPDRPVAEAVASSPAAYADASAFSNQCLAVVGRRPSELRILFTWEWVMWRALGGHGWSKQGSHRGRRLPG